MKIGIPKERRPGEKRVAASPETVKKFVGLGCTVTVETGAGLAADIPDSDYQAVGATIAADPATTLQDADLVLKVQRPMTAAEGNDELKLLKRGAILVAGLAALQQRDQVKAYAEAGITAFAMELMPRITRAQSMDILSSQSNLAGYKAVLDAAQHFGRAFPMMMTSAGTIAPARVFVMGVGVAGLQAIATAKRLGAVVSATDVRPATKEQVESLGGKFIWVDDEEARASQTAGGYAKEMSDAYKAKQAAQNDAQRIEAEQTIARLEAARDIALAESQDRWSATRIGRWLIVTPWGIHWALIYVVSILNPNLGTNFVIQAVPAAINDMALILIPAIIVGDAGALITKRLRR